MDNCHPVNNKLNQTNTMRTIPEKEFIDRLSPKGREEYNIDKELVRLKVAPEGGEALSVDIDRLYPSVTYIAVAEGGLAVFSDPEDISRWAQRTAVTPTREGLALKRKIQDQRMKVYRKEAQKHEKTIYVIEQAYIKYAIGETPSRVTNSDMTAEITKVTPKKVYMSDSKDEALAEFAKLEDESNTVFLALWEWKGSGARPALDSWSSWDMADFPSVSLISGTERAYRVSVIRDLVRGPGYEKIRVQISDEKTSFDSAKLQEIELGGANWPKWTPTIIPDTDGIRIL